MTFLDGFLIPFKHIAPLFSFHTLGAILGILTCLALVVAIAGTASYLLGKATGE